MKIEKNTIDFLLKASREKEIFLEGNILKIIEHDDNEELKKYLEEAIKRDRETRRKRLEITRQVQEQNKELLESKEENESLMVDLRLALDSAETAKQEAINDLDILQKKRQFELIGQIVNIALWTIVGVGILTTLLFLFAMITNRDTTLLGNTWSNLFGILLTNSFSIVGTIMGVKYATEGSNSSE